MIDWLKIVTGTPAEKRKERWEAAKALGDHLHTYRCRGKDLEIPLGLRTLRGLRSEPELLEAVAGEEQTLSDWRSHVTWLEGQNARSLIIVWDHLVFLRELVGHLVGESKDPIISAERVRSILRWANEAEELEAKIRHFLEREFPEAVAIPGADLRFESRCKTRRYDLCPAPWRELRLSP